MTTGLTLALDGSTYAGSVALTQGSELISERQLPQAVKPGREGREEHFLPMVAECLRDGKAEPRDLARIVCGEGPGSFTSLRIAGSIAKGLCLGQGIPLFAVSSLGLAAASSSARGTFVVTIDALRDEWYAAVFERDAAGVVSARGDVNPVG